MPRSITTKDTKDYEGKTGVVFSFVVLRVLCGSQDVAQGYTRGFPDFRRLRGPADICSDAAWGHRETGRGIYFLGTREDGIRCGPVADYPAVQIMQPPPLPVAPNVILSWSEPCGSRDMHEQSVSAFPLDRISGSCSPGPVPRIFIQGRRQKGRKAL